LVEDNPADAKLLQGSIADADEIPCISLLHVERLKDAL
jgi:hypothetical protein